MVSGERVLWSGAVSSILCDSRSGGFGVSELVAPALLPGYKNMHSLYDKHDQVSGGLLFWRAKNAHEKIKTLSH